MSRSRAAQELGGGALSRGAGAKVLRQRQCHHSPAESQEKPLWLDPRVRWGWVGTKLERQAGAQILQVLRATEEFGAQKKCDLILKRSPFLFGGGQRRGEGQYGRQQETQEEAGAPAQGGDTGALDPEQIASGAQTRGLEMCPGMANRSQCREGPLARAPPARTAGSNIASPAGVGWGLQRELLSI